MQTLRLLLILMLIYTLPTVKAQKIKQYKTWVTLTNDTKAIGILYSADKNGILIMREDLTQANIDSKTIEVIKLRRKGSVGRGVWIGALSGATAGAVTGYASGDDEPGWFSATAEEKALGHGLLLAFPGAGVGAIFGSGKTTFLINGDDDTYLAKLAEIKKYSLNK